MEKEIAQKLLSLQQISATLRESFTIIKSDIANGTAGTSYNPEDTKALSALPDALEEYQSLLKSLSEDWSRLILTNTDLGTITSYDGSVFNPQEISLVHVIHCIICDMEMLLNEACTSLTATGTAPHYTDTINKVYAVIASMQYLSQTAPAGKEFPSDKFGDKVDKITKALPDYTARVEAIGVQ